jgi:hypothetical protein
LTQEKHIVQMFATCNCNTSKYQLVVTIKFCLGYAHLGLKHNLGAATRHNFGKIPKKEPIEFVVPIWLAINGCGNCIVALGAGL